MELTPLEARAGGPYLERVYRDADRLFWELWEKAGGELSDACLVPMPNSWWEGFEPRRIEPLSALILHHTAMDDDETCISFFLQPSNFVSSHFLVGRDGRLFQFVSLEHRAWHAGASYLHGRSVLNRSSVGVEITGDPNCLMCHTSGFGAEKGFYTLQKPPALAGVHCQNCHRFNSDEHLRKGFAFTKVSENVCTSCHTPVTDPKFDFAARRARIPCGK